MTSLVEISFDLNLQLFNFYCFLIFADIGFHQCCQIELYNSMVEKEGTDGEKEAIKAYKAAREESDNSSEVSENEEVSSVLIDKVQLLVTKFCCSLFLSYHKQVIYNSCLLVG